MAAGAPPSFPPGPVVDPSDPGYPSAGNAAANQNAQAQRFADQMNNANIAAYSGAMAGYNYNVNAGRTPASVPPVPLAWIVKDGGIVLSDQPACPEIPVAHPVQLQSGLAGGGIVGSKSGITDIGAARGNLGFNCGPQDTQPLGFQVSLPDGHVYQKQAWGPFGFFYERVS